MRGPRFVLPPRGALSPNNAVDPHRYYYVPLLGRLFTGRIDLGLRLLTGLPRPRRVLELGYGSGLLMPTLCTTGAEVSGVDLHSDPAQVRAQLARLGVHPAELVRGPAQALPFPDGRFDLVVAFSLLEHIPEEELRQVLSETARVLAPEGRLLVGCPAVHRGMSLLFSAIGFRGIDEHHVSDIFAVQRAAAPHFAIERTATLPAPLPVGRGLYSAVLFARRSGRM